MIEEPCTNESPTELTQSSSGLSKELNQNPANAETGPRQTQVTFRPKKYPLISAALSFLFPGAGQLYNEQFIKALILFAATIASILSIIFSGISMGNIMLGNESSDTIPPAMPVIRIVASCLIWFSLWLYGIIDAIISAQRISNQPVLAAKNGSPAAKPLKKEGLIGLGVVLIVVGALSLLHRLGLSFEMLVKYGWLVALILLGIYVLVKTTGFPKGEK